MLKSGIRVSLKVEIGRRESFGICFCPDISKDRRTAKGKYKYGNESGKIQSERMLTEGLFIPVFLSPPNLVILASPRPRRDHPLWEADETGPYVINTC